MEKMTTPQIIHPPEVWRIILGNLKNNPSALLKLRLVSKTIRSIADELLKENFTMWSPTFHESCKELSESVIGTKLSAPHEIEMFFMQFDGVHTRSWNPFPNGTLKFDPSSTLDLSSRQLFYSKFANFLKTFGEDIFHLIYTFNDDSDGEIDHFLEFYNIFKLRNLKSLTIFKEKWHSSQTIAVMKLLAELFQLENFPFPRKLEELEILGADSWLLFSTLPSALKDLKSFCCYWTEIASDEGISLEEQLNSEEKGKFQLPKLTKLKLLFPTKVVIEHFCQAQPKMNYFPKITQICLSFTFCERLIDRPVGFIRIMFEQVIFDVIKALDYQAEYLETLHLNFASRMLTSLGNPIIDLDSDIKFVKLRHFIVSFNVIISWKLLLKELKGKMCCLEKVSLVLNYSEVEDLNVKQIYDCVKDVWDLLPESVEIIHVPYFGWRLGRGDEMHFGIYL